MSEIQQIILNRCQTIFPGWRKLEVDDVKFGSPKGFSTFTMSVEPIRKVIPNAIFYRRMEGKENAILEFENEKSTYLLLAKNHIAAKCYHYSHEYRLESFYKGKTLQPADLYNSKILKNIADQLYRLHQLQPSILISDHFFRLLFKKWGLLAKQVLENESKSFPENEQEMCRKLQAIYSPDTLNKVERCIPKGPLSFCHNDTYHGNIMKLNSGEIKLLDFEFSCLNNKAYDFSNLFAETVMKHNLPEYPFFKIADPDYDVRHISILINHYLDNYMFTNVGERKIQFKKLLDDTNNMLLLSHFKYALAAIPLAVKPIQKIRFIPYSYQRFTKFLQLYEQRFS